MSVMYFSGVPVVVGRLESYPFPLAYPAHLARTARDPADRLEKAGHFIEMTAVTLGVLVLGWCRAHQAAAEDLTQWENTLERKGAALGGWIALLGSTRAVLMAAGPGDALGRALALAVDGARERLEGFTPTRNQFAHGGRPRIPGEVEVAASELAARASTLLDSMESLHQVRIAVVRGCRPVAAGTFEVDLDVLAGYAEAPATQRLRSRREFEPGAVVAYASGRLDSAADLSPYCVYRACSVCGRDELFYLTKRKRNRADHFTFANGHELRLKRDRASEQSRPLAALGMEPLTARRTESAQGWRASWLDLANRRSRIAARGIDLAAIGALSAAIGLLTHVIGLPTRTSIVAGLVVLLSYEPIAAVRGGTLGKRLAGIEAISVWNAQPLSTADAVRRALAVDLSIVLPPFAVYSLAWIIWDPARQGFHDRFARSIVVAGRAPAHHKV